MNLLKQDDQTLDKVIQYHTQKYINEICKSINLKYPVNYNFCV